MQLPSTRSYIHYLGLGVARVVLLIFQIYINLINSARLKKNAIWVELTNYTPQTITTIVSIVQSMLYSRLVEPSRHGTDKATSRD